MRKPDTDHSFAGLSPRVPPTGRSTGAAAVQRTLAWLNRNRRLAKDFEASIASVTSLRRDPVTAVPDGKLAAKRGDCSPLAGKSTLN